MKETKQTALHSSHSNTFLVILLKLCRSQWPRVLRRRSAVARLLRSWVRISLGGGHGCFSFVSVVCCQVEVSATSWSLVQRSPTDCGASLWCDLETSRMRRPCPALGRSATKNKLYFLWIFIKPILIFYFWHTIDIHLWIFITDKLHRNFNLITREYCNMFRLFRVAILMDNCLT
jgi:hypothetical protein